MIVDLESVDPTGRLDVAAYKLLGLGVRHLEAQNGLAGLWDVIKPHAGTLVNKYLNGIEIPAEAEVVLKLMALGHQQRQVEREG